MRNQFERCLIYFILSYYNSIRAYFFIFKGFLFIRNIEEFDIDFSINNSYLYDKLLRINCDVALLYFWFLFIIKNQLPNYEIHWIRNDEQSFRMEQLKELLVFHGYHRHYFSLCWNFYSRSYSLHISSTQLIYSNCLSNLSESQKWW